MKNHSSVVKFIYGVILFFFSLSIFSFLLIYFFEARSYLFFPSSEGFKIFLDLYDFPVKLISASIAIFSVLAIVDNIIKTRTSFLYGQIINELYRCEDEIKEIISNKISVDIVRMTIQIRLGQHANFCAVQNCFNNIANPELSIDEIVPYLVKFGVFETDGVFRIDTQKLTLRLVRYSLALLELSKMPCDKMLVRYYASKYISLMIDLHNYKSELDKDLILICYQLGSVPQNYDYNFVKINGNDHISISEKFYRQVEQQRKACY